MSEPYPVAKREHPSTYFVQDRSNEEELTRLCVQDAMLTTSMGGVLPEQVDPTSFRQVLDVGCGTGGWLIILAQTYLSIQTVMGVDVSTSMVAFARQQAHAARLEDRVEFHTSDVLRRIEFPDRSFDLVNQRLGISYLRIWGWAKVFQEYRRVVQPGGMIRITEASTMIENSSPALTQISTIAHNAYTNAGYLFSTEPESIIEMLPRLMTQHGIENIQTQTYHLVYRAGTPEGQQFADDMVALFRVSLPFLNKWTRLPDDYEAIRQRRSRRWSTPILSQPGRFSLPGDTIDA